MNGRSSPTPRTVLVTGASAGFGAALVKRLAGEGHRVVAAARRTERLAQVAAGFPGTVLPLALDVQDRQAVAQALAKLPEDFSAIDVLVNNAGVALGMAPAQAASLDHWDRMLDTNCKGMAYLTHAVLPGMVRRGRGHIVNLGSVAGSYPYPGGNVYGATKAFVHQFSLNLRSDLHGTGVRVTCVEPGLCGGTEFSEVRFEGDREKAAKVYAGMQPLSAEDVAEAIAWALSQPAHVNINTIEMMPVAQSFGAFQVHREG